MNLAIVNGTCTGLTPADTSVDTTAGAGEVKAVGTTTVISGSAFSGTLQLHVADGTLNRSVAVAVMSDDSEAVGWSGKCFLETIQWQL